MTFDRYTFLAYSRGVTPAAQITGSTVHLYGAIGGDWGEISAGLLVPDIRAIDADQIDVYISSPGGDVYEAIAIRNALTQHRARIITHVDGLAASAASFIATAGDEVVMGENAQLMIHDAWSVGMGNADDLRQTADQLDQVSDNIAAMYAADAGGTADQWRATMRAETWYTAAEAVAAGLADRIETSTDTTGTTPSKENHAMPATEPAPVLNAATPPAAAPAPAVPAATPAPVASATPAVPATQRPAGHTGPRAAMPGIAAITAAIAEVKNAVNPAAPPLAALKILNALSDVKITGTGALPDGGDVLQPNWLGQLYQGIPYVREYITLGTLGTDITAGGKKGYRLHRGTSSVPVDHYDGTWAGNKAAIASGTGFTEAAKSELLRFAFGHDIAREFYDLPGGAEVVTAFLSLVLEDHAVWSDERARETWLQVAGAPVANKTYPSVDGHDYPDALGQVIQGILAVKAKKSDGRRDQPTFIIANEAAYEELIYTPKDLVPEFVKFTASTDWTGTGDGLVLTVGDTGIQSTSSVIVGAASAVQFDELPGGPVHIDAIDLAKGGVDEAVHAYLQRFIVRPEAVVHVGAADAWASATTYRAGDLAKVSTSILQATTAGKSAGTAPTPPALGETVTDGGVTWARIA